MSVVFGGKLIDGRSSSTAAAGSHRLTGDAETFLRTWSDEPLLNSPLRGRRRSYASPSSSKKALQPLYQTAPSKLTQSGTAQLKTPLYAHLPVFILPPIEPPPSFPPQTQQRDSFHPQNIQRHISKLTPAEVARIRKYLSLRESEWEDIRLYFSVNDAYKDSSSQDARWSVFETTRSATLHYAFLNNGHNNGPIILQGKDIPLRSSTTSKILTSKSQDKNSRFSRRTQGKNQLARTPHQRLQQELLESLQSMQSHSNYLKAGLLELPKIVNIKENKAVMYLQSLGAQKVFKVLRQLCQHQLKIGWKAWRLSIEVGHKSSNVQRVLRLIKYRVLSVTWSKVVTKCLRRALKIWLAFVYYDTLLARRRIENLSAVSLQKIFRGHLVRRRRIQNQERRELERVYSALVRIQAFFRGRIARFRYLQILRINLEDRSRRLLQKLVRGYQGRRKAHWLRVEKLKRSGVTLFQALYRGWRVRSNLSTIRRKQREYAASVLIQALVRGYLCRVHIRDIRLRQRQAVAVVHMQRTVRGHLFRNHLPLLLADIAAYRHRRRVAAVSIQKMYRGFRARVIVRIMRREYKRIRGIQDPAATRINAAIRGFLAKKLRRRLERERYRKWLGDARNVRECWSDADNCWYYYNEATGESTWEPPSTGYTKNDSQLVLANGQVIDDPTVFAPQEGGEGAAQPMDSKMCSECTKRVAIRFCTQCGDKFCCPCYKEQHSSGSRLRHVWEPLGPRECGDCEAELAERYCLPCDEAFCDSCWQRVHFKGKRRFHSFSQIDVNGNIDSRLFTIDGNEVTSSYDPLYVQQQFEETSNSLVPSALDQPSSLTDEWAYAYDDNGYIYWYNGRTGQSQYEDPYTSNSIS